MNQRRLGSLGQLPARLALIFSLAGPATAEEVVFDFSGTITGVTQTGTTPVGGPYDVSAGETFSGTFSYNSDTPAYYSQPGYNAFADPTSQISVTIGSTTFGESFVAQSGSPYTGQAVNYDEPNGGQYDNYFTTQSDSVAVANGIQTNASIAAFFNSLTASPLGILPSSGLPTSLSLADFNSYSLLNLDATVQNNSTGIVLSSFYVQGNITSLTLVPSSVPEPSTIVLMGLGVSVIASGRVVKRRRSTSAA